MRRAARTVYVVTDRRAVFFQGGWVVTVRSVTPEEVGIVTRKQRPDGWGDLIFGPAGDAPPTSATATMAASGDLGAGFFGIERVAEVERLVKRLAAKGGGGRSSA